MLRTTCMVCKSKEIKEIMNLGMHPFADTFIPEEKFAIADKAYPLICDLCMNCGQVQLRCSTDPNDRYCGVDYSYTSSNSNFSRTHWIEYFKEVSAKINLKKDGVVVEVGSNDGFLTEQFAKIGCKTIGVDPSSYMADLAKERNIETITELFGINTVQKIMNKVGRADLIIANNVFNHSENPVEFAQAVAQLLAKNGTFVFELPYWAISIESKKFDQIYHEHVSYLTAKSSQEIMERAGMRITHVEVVNYHGGSLRVYSKLREDNPYHCQEAIKLIEKEREQGLFKVETYKKFMEELYDLRNKFLKRIYQLREEGARIIAVGAAAKGNTFLNFFNLDQKTIDYVTDSSPHKQGKYTPLTRIPITDDEIFSNYKDKEVYALILSWNLADILRPIIHKINPQVKFISPEKF